MPLIRKCVVVLVKESESSQNAVTWTLENILDPATEVLVVLYPDITDHAYHCQRISGDIKQEFVAVKGLNDSVCSAFTHSSKFFVRFVLVLTSSKSSSSNNKWNLLFATIWNVSFAISLPKMCVDPPSSFVKTTMQNYW